MIVKVLSVKDKIIYAMVASIMGCLNVIVLVGSYWFYLDIQSPIRIDYHHPHFVSQEVRSPSEAERYSIETAREGQVVFRYVEYCVLVSKPGTVQKSWINGVIYQTPSIPTLAQVGCYKRSIAEIVPPLPGHMVKFNVKTTFDNNPLRSVYITNPQLSLVVTR